MKNINIKFLKKNQIAIYTIALMLVVAGYLNFTSNGDMKSAIYTSGTEEELVQLANIGDAQLVSSIAYTEENELVENNTIETNNLPAKENDNYFSKSKLERDTMYSQIIETYNNILNNANSSETQKETATTEIKRINEEKNSIMISENLIKTKGFKDVVIFVNSNSVSIIVEDDELTKEEVSQIQNIISREMNVVAENIHISSK